MNSPALFWLLGVFISGVIPGTFFLLCRWLEFKNTEIMRQSLKQSQISAVLFTSQGQVQYVNPAFEKLTGYTLAELQGKPVSAFKNNLNDEQTYQTLCQSLQAQHLSLAELLMRRKNGEVFWLKAIIQPMFRGQRLIGYRFIGEDITRQKNLTQSLQRRLDELSLVYEISLAAASRLELQSLVELTGQKLEQAFQVKSVFIALYDPQEQIITTPYWTIDNQRVEAEPIAYGQGLTSTVLKNKAPLLIDADFATLAPQLGAQLTFAKTNGLPKTWLGVPILYGSEALGVISLQNYEKEKAFSQEDIRLLKTLAANIGAALYNARLFAEAQNEISAREQTQAMLRRRAEELAVFFNISAELSSNLELKEVLHALLEKCRQLLEFDVFYVAVYDPQHQILYHPLFYDQGKLRNVPARDLRVTPGLSGEVILSRQTLHLPDTQEPEISARYQIIHAGGPSTRCYVGVPLLAHKDVIGVISMQSYTPNYYQPEQITLLESIAPLAAIAIENSRLYEAARAEAEQRRASQEELRQANRSLTTEITRVAALRDKLHEQAVHDPLTGLYNRRYLEEVFPIQVSQQGPFSLVMLDIDHFKNFNDQYGHPAGDVLLSQLGQLLRRKIRRNDIACRYGGEEFLILLPETSLQIAAQRAERIRQACAEMKVEYDGQQLGVTLSLGVVSFPIHGGDPQTLLTQVDQALYAAKQAGRNCVYVWRP